MFGKKKPSPALSASTPKRKEEEEGDIGDTPLTKEFLEEEIKVAKEFSQSTLDVLSERGIVNVGDLFLLFENPKEGKEKLEGWGIKKENPLLRIAKFCAEHQPGKLMTIPTFVSETVQSVMDDSAALQFVASKSSVEAESNLVRLLEETPTVESRNLMVHALIGPMGRGKTRAVIEASCAAAQTYAAKNSKKEPAPLVLYLNVPPKGTVNPESDGTAELSKAILYAHRKRAELLPFIDSISVSNVIEAIRRDGFTKVILVIDEIQLDHALVGKILEGCDLTMKSRNYGLVVVPLLAGISLPTKKTIPSFPSCESLFLEPFADDAFLEPFCQRIGVKKKDLENSTNLKQLFDLCAGNPHVVSRMVKVIRVLSDNAEFRAQLQQKLSAEYAHKVYQLTIKELVYTYGLVRWHGVVRGLDEKQSEHNFREKHDSWDRISKHVVKWIFCEAFLGTAIARNRKVGTIDQKDSNFPTIGQCEEAGLFTVNENRIEMPLLGLMVLDDIVHILPVGVNDPFDQSWQHFEWIGAASVYVRLKLAQLHGEKTIKFSVLRSEAQQNHVESIVLDVPSETELRFKVLGAKATGKPGELIREGKDGKGDPVVFSPGLVAMTMKGETAVDALVLLNATIDTRNALIAMVNQTKERDKNIGNGEESQAALHNGQKKKFFQGMEQVFNLYAKQFALPTEYLIIFDIFSDRIDPKRPLAGLETVNDCSYCITRENNFSKVVGPGFTALCNKRARLME